MIWVKSLLLYFALQLCRIFVIILEPCSNCYLDCADLLRTKDDPPVSFLFFSRNNSNNNLSYNIDIDNFQGLIDSGFENNLETKIVIHGFRSSIQEEIFKTIKDAYMETGNFNIIGVDWSELSNGGYIGTIASGIYVAGLYLYDFLAFLYKSGVDFNRVHLIGHSLGAHVSGLGIRKLKETKVQRITALDPAGPGFRDTFKELKKSDAQLVEVIHTHLNILGLMDPIGHIDFYPNGGRLQPGCPSIYDIENFFEGIECNHARSYYLFAESIKNKKAFLAKKCLNLFEAVHGFCSEDSNVHMGQVETYEYGLYYFPTNSKSPYSVT